jgi:hypothetical protein
MILITKDQWNYFEKFVNQTDDIGYVCDFGALIGEAKWVIKEENEKYFIGHISEFIQKDCLIKEK